MLVTMGVGVMAALVLARRELLVEKRGMATTCLPPCHTNNSCNPLACSAAV